MGHLTRIEWGEGDEPGFDLIPRASNMASARGMTISGCAGTPTGGTRIATISIGRRTSMIDAGISDGDVVVVDRDVTPRSGHIVIAIVAGGFVCRQLVQRGGVPYLEARNSRQSYPEQIADDQTEVWGVVRAGVRDYQR